MSALRAEARQLNQFLATVPAGSQAAADALRQLAAVRDDVGDLRAEIASLAPDAQIKGFLALGEAATAGFTVATVAAKEFGLSGGAIEEYQAKVVGLIGVIESLETFRAALEPQRYAGILAIGRSITGTLASVRAGFTLTAIQARIASITIRQALLATGVGALVVAIGLLIANFEKVKEVGGRIYQTYKSTFDGLRKLIDDNSTAIRTFFAITTGGLSELGIFALRKYKEFTAASAVELATATSAANAELAKSAAFTATKVAEAALSAANARKAAADTALAKIRQNNAEETEEVRKAVKEQAEARRAVEDAGFARRAASETDRRSKLQLRQDDEKAGLTLANATEKQKLDAQIRFARESLQLEQTILAERKKLRKTGNADEDQLLQEEQNKQRVLVRQKLADVRTAEQAVTKLLADEQEKRNEQEFEDFKKRTEGIERIPVVVDLQPDFGAIPTELPTIPVAVKPEVAESAFEDITQSIQRAAQTVSSIVSGLAGEAAGQLDAQLDALDARLDTLDKSLDETRTRIQTDEKSLEGATGARRAALIAKIEQEKKAEAALAAQKSKAAADQLRVEKERQKLQERADQANRASVAVETILATIAMIRTAAESGKFSGPAAPFVIAATAAAGIAAALTLKNALKFREGGLLDGPSHEQGGIRGRGAFGNVEVEGGEFIVNRKATAQYLPLLHQINDVGRTRYIPAPNVRFAGGGVLPSPTATSQSGVTTTEVVDALGRIEMRLVSVEQAVMIAPTLLPKPVLRIGTIEAEAISEQQTQAAQQKALATF